MASPVLLPGQPLTMYGYSVHCSRVALERSEVARVFCQARRQGVVYCGQVVACESTEKGEYFKLDTDVGRMWFPARSTRMCSGDGHCTCEGSR